jgi:putative addiction module antidote
MNKALKITKVGNSAAIILPKDVLAHLRTPVGESLSVTKTPRGIELAPVEDDFETQMSVARDVMVRRRQALRELAK